MLSFSNYHALLLVRHYETPTKGDRSRKQKAKVLFIAAFQTYMKPVLMRSSSK